MTPSPWMIRTTAENRVDNQLARTPVANHRRRRSLRLQTRFTRFAPHAANRSPTPGPPGEPPHTPPRDGSVAAAERLFAPRSATASKTAWERPIGDGADSPLPPRPPRYRHDCSRLHGSGSAVAGSVSTCADEPFFSASARTEFQASYGETRRSLGEGGRRRRTGARPQPHRRRVAHVRPPCERR